MAAGTSSTETDSSFDTEPTSSAPPPASATSQVRRSLAVDNTRRRSLDELKYKIIPPPAVGEDDASEELDYKHENANARRTSGEDTTIWYWGWSRDIVPANVHGGTDGDTEETNEVQDAMGGFPGAPGPSPRAFLMNASSSSKYMAQRRSDRECQPDDISEPTSRIQGFKSVSVLESGVE